LSSATVAQADRPITDQEKGRLVEALKAQGCSGGKMEFDDGKFEVDDAICADGKKYDIKFDQSYQMIDKKLES
jgi:tellurite resistance protein